MQTFDYIRPSSIDDVVAALARQGARALAGGTDLVAQLKEGRRTAAHVVDLKAVPELATIETRADGSVAIGAAVSASAVASAASGPLAAYPAVTSAARLIGSLQIQNRATIGGNICNAAPSADAVPPLLVHEARAECLGPNGARTLPLTELFVGPGRTCLQSGEILAQIVLPPAAERTAARYERFTPRREMDIAIAGVASLIELDAGGVVVRCRIALASVAPTPILAPAAAASLVGKAPARGALREAGQIAAGEARPISDTRGSADYRRDLVAVLVERTLADCLHQLGREPA